MLKTSDTPSECVLSLSLQDGSTTSIQTSSASSQVLDCKVYRVPFPRLQMYLSANLAICIHGRFYPERPASGLQQQGEVIKL